MRNALLVPSASRPGFCDERAHPQGDPIHRSQSQRDRDRVLYSSAFKRLAHVTQVTASEAGLTFHSRLMHSLKVAQFARRLTDRLKRLEYQGAANRVIENMDADAAEAAALAHDLGHPPFGHLAEQELNALAAEFGGFEGNAQSFRVLTRLALQSARYEGLNLTRRTLNGVVKYPWLREDEDPLRSVKWNAYVADQQAFDWARKHAKGTNRSIEAEIMDWADDVTYAVHDMDDFYRAGLVPLERLCQGGTELAAFQSYLVSKHPDNGAKLAAVAEQLFGTLMNFDTRYSGTQEERIDLRAAGSGLITRYIEAPSVEPSGNQVVFAVAEQMRDEVDALKELIWFYVIERPSLAILQKGQRRVIRELFHIYAKAAEDKATSIFPALYQERLNVASTPAARIRIVVDLISTMTETSAIEVYRRMTGIVGASVIDPTGRLA